MTPQVLVFESACVCVCVCVCVHVCLGVFVYLCVQKQWRISVSDMIHESGPLTGVALRENSLFSKNTSSD